MNAKNCAKWGGVVKVTTTCKKNLLDKLDASGVRRAEALEMGIMLILRERRYEGVLDD